MSGDDSFTPSLKICADYMLEVQHEDGLWDAFKAQKKTDYYSSMIQSQGVSLMLKMHTLTGEEKYLESAKKAFAAILKPVEEGGTALIKNGHIQLLEAPDRPMILNGAIYSAFGVLDMLVFTEEEQYREILDSVLAGIKDELQNFDTGFWSKYCLDGAYASPFYQRVYITQLKLLAKLFNDDVFSEEALKYKRYLRRRVNYFLAFTIKAFQKITEKNDIVAIIE